MLVAGHHSGSGVGRQGGTDEIVRGLEGFLVKELTFYNGSLWMLLEKKFLKADKSSQVLVF